MRSILGSPYFGNPPFDAYSSMDCLGFRCLGVLGRKAASPDLTNLFPSFVRPAASKRFVGSRLADGHGEWRKGVKGFGG